jgi:hypothetical protein
LILSTVGLAAAGVAAVTLTTAQAAESGPTATPAPADMPYAVESFEHPGAGQILENRKIKVMHGDGRIMLKPGDGQGGSADCSDGNDIWIESRVDKKGFCFTASARSGYLQMEIPDAYAIWTEDRPVSAKLTTEDKTSTVDAPKNNVTQVGESSVPGGRKRSVLVELRITG